MSSYLLVLEIVNMEVIVNGILRITQVGHQMRENPDYISNR